MRRHAEPFDSAENNNTKVCRISDSYLHIWSRQCHQQRRHQLIKHQVHAQEPTNRCLLNLLHLSFRRVLNKALSLIFQEFFLTMCSNFKSVAKFFHSINKPKTILMEITICSGKTIRCIRHFCTMVYPVVHTFY